MVCKFIQACGTHFVFSPKCFYDPRNRKQKSLARTHSATEFLPTPCEHSLICINRLGFTNFRERRENRGFAFSKHKSGNILMAQSSEIFPFDREERWERRNEPIKKPAPADYQPSRTLVPFLTSLVQFLKKWFFPHSETKQEKKSEGKNYLWDYATF